jgi:hypothetical protein
MVARIFTGPGEREVTKANIAIAKKRLIIYP